MDPNKIGRHFQFEGIAISQNAVNSLNYASVYLAMPDCYHHLLRLDSCVWCSMLYRVATPELSWGALKLGWRISWLAILVILHSCILLQFSHVHIREVKLRWHMWSTNVIQSMVDQCVLMIPSTWLNNRQRETGWVNTTLGENFSQM